MEVPDEERRKGHAKRLLEVACGAARGRGYNRVHLLVAIDNEPARGLYAGQDFEFTGPNITIRDYVRDPEKGYTDRIQSVEVGIMVKNLSGSEVQ